MQQYRYPGTRPFAANDRNLFFGRNDDIVNLSNLIALENIVVLYGKSGLGKTSLLNAGVIPHLKETGLYETYPVRFGAYIQDNSITPIEIFKSSVQRVNNQNNFIFNKLIPKNQISQHQLWYALKDIQLLKPENTCFVIVFDQFEELFTYPENQIEQFKKELSELLNVKLPQQLRNILKDKLLTNKEYLTKGETALLYQSINLKIVFSIRSDRMSYLNRMTDYLPTILKKCFELQPLTSEQAISAIVEPAKKQDNSYISQSFDYDKIALNEIIGFLSKNGQQKIETFLLQIVCQYSENIAIKNKFSIIKSNDLGDLQNISKNFYDNIIQELPEIEREPARILLEEGLILEDEERRLSLYEGQIYKQFGISKELLQKLVDTHILRSEPYHSGGFMYEISHDTLVAPIIQSKKIRNEKEKLIYENELHLQEFERKEKEKDEKRNKKTKRILISFSVIISIIAILSITASIFGYVMWRKSDNQAKITAENLEKIKNSFIREALFLMNDEQYGLAIQKYTYIRDSVGFKDTSMITSVNKRIKTCEDLLQTSKIYYNLIKKSDSLINLKNIENLILARTYLTAAKKLKYDKQINKTREILRLKSKYVDDMIETEIKLLIKTSEIFITGGYRSEAVYLLKKILQIDPDNIRAKELLEN